MSHMYNDTYGTSNIRFFFNPTLCAITIRAGQIYCFGCTEKTYIGNQFTKKSKLDFQFTKNGYPKTKLDFQFTKKNIDSKNQFTKKRKLDFQFTKKNINSNDQFTKNVNWISNLQKKTYIGYPIYKKNELGFPIYKKRHKLKGPIYKKKLNRISILQNIYIHTQMIILLKEASSYSPYCNNRRSCRQGRV